MIFAWSMALVALVPAAMTLFNLFGWPRARRLVSDLPPISICIPARDEERVIERSVRAALACGPAELVVFDDGSTDRTQTILDRLADEDDRLVVVRHDEGLPSGWVGKVHACHQLARQASHDTLLFVDADTCLHPDALGRLHGLATRFDARAVS